MSMLSNDLAQQMSAAFMEAYVDGEDPWPAALATFGEMILSDEAVDAAAQAMCLPSLWLGADEVQREAMRSDAHTGLKAALDAVTGQSEETNVVHPPFPINVKEHERG